MLVVAAALLPAEMHKPGDALRALERLRRPDIARIRNSPEDIRVPGGQPPHLVFASDQPTGELESMLAEPGVVADLIHLKAGIALAPNLTVDEANLVRQLNRDGIPVTAGLTVPTEQGYYLNASNGRQAEVRFEDFEKWTTANELRWAGIGLDIEPNIQDFATLRQGRKWHLFSTLLERYFDMRRVREAKYTYGALIQEIRSHGYQVETYQFPFIADERAVRSSVLERLTGIVDVRGNLEVLMLYTSFNQSLDSALIWVYGPYAQAIAVGSTTGPTSDPHFARLNWEEFSRDLMVANHFSRVIGVYNLEGCVREGFLPRLKNLNWNESVTISAESARRATRLRVRVQRALWIASNLPYFFGTILVAFIFAIVWRNKRRRRRTAHPRGAAA
ncbi:MAG: hypothetical protein WB869_00040 [Candidatus Acidiferrales bacterium]